MRKVLLGRRFADTRDNHFSGFMIKISFTSKKSRVEEKYVRRLETIYRMQFISRGNTFEK